MGSYTQICSFSWAIFVLFVPVDTGITTLQRSYETYNFAVTESPHYMVRLKQDKTAVIRLFHYLTANMSLWVTCSVYLQAVFKMSAVCTDTLCQPTSPLVNSHVSNLLLVIFADTLCSMQGVALWSKIMWRIIWFIYGVIK